MKERVDGKSRLAPEYKSPSSKLLCRTQRLEFTPSIGIVFSSVQTSDDYQLDSMYPSKKNHSMRPADRVIKYQVERDSKDQQSEIRPVVRSTLLHQTKPKIKRIYCSHLRTSSFRCSDLVRIMAMGP
jgi:hypothetical protein